MEKFFKPAVGLFIALIVLIISLNFADAAEDLSVGTGVYQFDEPTGATKDPINIHYHRPKNWKPGDKIFVYFHGMGRKPWGIIKGLKDKAEEKNFLLICPEFTKAKYPGNRYYNYGNVRGGKNYAVLNENSKWTFNAVNRIIDDVKSRTRAGNSKVIFLGHSAGAQFMHRYLFFADEIKADLVISANAGAYLLPDEKNNYPYGMKNVPVGENELKRAYAHNVIILLGENDVKRSKELPTSPSAERQGKNRFERGKNFYAVSQAKAAEIGAEFNWQLVTVPNVGHFGKMMAKAALKYI